MRVCTYLAGVLVASGAVACGAIEEPPPPPPYQLSFVVEGDPGKPLAGAELRRGDETVATTGEDGRAELLVRGHEGEKIEVSVACPPGFHAPSKPMAIRLTRLASKNAPEFKAQCVPARRRVVVAVRAENGAGLPVTYLNQVVATTDETGAAHFTLDLEPGTFQVALDTTDRKDLKPQNPRRTFTVQKDDILVFDEKFSVEKKIRAKTRPTGPTCLTCGRGG